MVSAARLRCWLIGTDSLLTECAEMLLRARHEILGVIAPTGPISAWALSRSIAVVDPADDYAALLAQNPFDVLFAIAHFSLVPDAVLRLPACGAINFHDGPLPEYAGRNAPVWALIQGETRYGITWHVMTSVVDAGDILKQRFFDVDADETSLSLNAKCFEAALDSFGELIDELASQTTHPLVQDGGRRRVYERHRRPPAACALDWTRPASEIEALVRALDFGRYPNPIGLAKLRRAGRSFAVVRARASEEQSGADAATAGSVLAFDADSVHVSTGHGALELRGFTDLLGNSATPAEVARQLGLAPGIALDQLTPELTRDSSELDRRMSRAERFWVRRLIELDPISLPIPVATAEHDAPVRPTAVNVEVPRALSKTFAGRPLATLLIATFCAYLARLARRRSFDIGFRDTALFRDAQGLEGWIVSRVPLRVEVDLEADLAQLVDRVSIGISEIGRRGPWLRDIIARYPELHALRVEHPGELLPVAIECRATFALPTLPDGAEWTFEIAEDLGACRCVFDAGRISPAHAESLQRGFAAMLASLVARPTLALSLHDAVDSAERDTQLAEWNRTARPQRRDVCVHVLFEEQARRTPQSIALVCDGRSLTYAELDARANLLAAELRALGVRRGQIVGVHLERSPELVIAILGTLKAAGAYLPLDPAFPGERLAFMVEDAQLGVIVTQTQLANSLPTGAAKLLVLDAGAPRNVLLHPEHTAEEARANDLAYVIYTSGSTGRPKGVLVEHRNVASFFAAMDEHVEHEPPGTWLAVTSLSFDISVLELLWTLTRGFKVILHSGRTRARGQNSPSRREIEFSLFYFSSDEADDRGAGYRLLLEGAKFADTNGFRAVWTPERHFHAFGGLFPNPAVTGAAIAAITNQVEIRAGSVVLPLHHPIRVAEEWALVDNLSAGRVGISFASGWHPNDFVLAPQNHASAKAVMFRDIEVVRRLWRGESMTFLGADGAEVEVRTRPRPVQPELPVWITSAGNIETFVEAGRIGANVLTHLLGQSVEQLASKIDAYREARAASGSNTPGVVSLMLHTFVGEDEERVREHVREPLERYLASSLSLVKDHAASFPAFHRSNGRAADSGDGLATLDSEERAALLAHARDRYYETSGLFGDPERCGAMVERLRAIGVDEIACLIDFGVPADDVLASLPLLDRVRRRAQERLPADAEIPDASLLELIRDAGVTHLQCTPSMASVLCSDPAAAEVLRNLNQLLVGGEALPEDLARELSASCGAVTNMYGPTETTIWSSTHRVKPAPSAAVRSGTVAIGRPIANTLFYVLDEALQPLPIGVAGELVIGGDGVARGYLRRPELDAQRFVADPFAGVHGARMYRTGDLVRYRADGVVEFLGRTDQQIKVRGHRIEPGEIESLLARETSVGEAVVVAREDTPGDQRLVAYVVARGSRPDAALLRERLRAQLPAYMIPSQFVFLERIPRTPNNKIDRRALPVPESSSRKTEQLALPTGDLETELAQLWQRTLGLERVGVEDNFFDLGGHSVLAVRIHRRLHELTAKRVSLTDLFRFPTIRSLARFLSTGSAQIRADEASLRGRRRTRSMQRLRQRTGER